MLEYFSYKKIKKHQAEKRAETQVQSPLLNEEDENFLERIVSAEGTPPPLPERPHGLGPEAGDTTGNSSQLVSHDGRVDEKNDKGKGKENEKAKDAKKANRFSFLTRSGTKKDKKLSPNEKVVTPDEAVKEEDDINKILDDLNLAAVNNRAFSISKESQELVQKFTVILKDLVNGVPTAYDDLVGLLNDSQGTLAKQYDHLPSFLQKLITQLPNKLTSNLAPELLAVATEAQALNVGSSASGAGAGFAGAAKSFLRPSNLKDLVTKPGAVVSMLKAIMNALKLRWPAFMGTNVLLSLGLFVLLFVFWYCHKRGRETRIEREKTVDSEGRIVEVDDDPMLGEAGPSQSTIRSRRSHDDREQGNTSGHDHTNLRPDDRPSSSRTKSLERRSVGAGAPEGK
ncbi:hypothetical protein D0Z07_3144 [Hyphodiscus hymeniophilus]|uniref:Ring-like domain-containing protein n=1 Tax=Hyphodiscus hymeniophilus TaxID=353542 RepID=A0A9P7AYM8_9HELO|nr:hypothetical protein D0Z07_3144 [Hyphodiscus hymeniophilus]